jgi:hypothetical protein
MLLKEGCAIKEHPSEAFVDGADEETFLVEVSVDGVTLRFTPHAWARCRQRAVPLWAISLALEVAPVFHHGDFVHCLTDRFLFETGSYLFHREVKGADGRREEGWSHPNGQVGLPEAGKRLLATPQPNKLDIHFQAMESP